MLSLEFLTPVGGLKRSDKIQEVTYRCYDMKRALNLNWCHPSFVISIGATHLLLTGVADLVRFGKPGGLSDG